MDLAYSVNNVPIRLTYERWHHIVENHDDLASYYYDVLETIERPHFVIRGSKGSQKATKNFSQRKRCLAMISDFIKEDCTDLIEKNRNTEGLYQQIGSKIPKLIGVKQRGKIWLKLTW